MLKTSVGVISGLLSNARRITEEDWKRVSGRCTSLYGGNSQFFLEKLDQGSLDHWIEDRGSRIKNQGSAQNKSNKLNKLIGMIDCLST